MQVICLFLQTSTSQNVSIQLIDSYVNFTYDLFFNSLMFKMTPYPVQKLESLIFKKVVVIIKTNRSKQRNFSRHTK